jgi:HlyD family secretion protein
MNNAGTVLLTIADMSIIEAEVEVDETDIPSVTLGQRASIVIDAMPGRTFAGKVTEIGNSPIETTGAGASAQATNFKVVVTLEGQIPDVRPGFTCTAEIITATREQALAIPIQATTVREVVLDGHGTLVREPEVTASAGTAVLQAADLKPGQQRKEVEGVFVEKDGRAIFTPTTTGIAGDKYFEALAGVREGDRIITGPFTVVRELKDGMAVSLEPTKSAGGRR